MKKYKVAKVRAKNLYEFMKLLEDGYEFVATIDDFVWGPCFILRKKNHICW